MIKKFLLYVAQRVESSFVLWGETKQRIEQSLPFHHDWLHLVAGILIYLAVLALGRGRWLPAFAWGITLLVAVVNEAIDMWLPNTDGIYRESLSDILVTILLPTGALLFRWLRTRTADVGTGEKI